MEASVSTKIIFVLKSAKGNDNVPKNMHGKISSGRIQS